MSFKLIKNKAQDIAVKGFIATASLCIILQLFTQVKIDESVPFLLVWVMVWVIGASANSNKNEGTE